jgi:hypothetical protein
MSLRCAVRLVAIGVGGCASHPAPNSQTSTVFEQLKGTWSEEHTNCQNPNVVSFDDDRTMMLIEYAEVGWATETDSRKVFRYRILSTDHSAIRVQLENESRLDEKGKPVVWHIVVVDAETYCWGRDDWPQGACTPPRKRCEI